MILLLISKIHCECDKSIPIEKGGVCSNDYCTEIEFQNGDCIISNSIIKTQWLNNLISLGDNDVTYYSSIQIPNNEIFLVTSNYFDHYINIYSLTSFGEIYNLKKISSPYFLDTMNSVGLIINNKLYILICHTEEFKCVLMDYENEQIYYKDVYNLFNYADEDEADFCNYNSYYTIINLNQIIIF